MVSFSCWRKWGRLSDWITLRFKNKDNNLFKIILSKKWAKTDDKYCGQKLSTPILFDLGIIFIIAYFNLSGKISKTNNLFSWITRVHAGQQQVSAVKSLRIGIDFRYLSTIQTAVSTSLLKLYCTCIALFSKVQYCMFYLTGLLLFANVSYIYFK